jgi:hypothetical protein
LVSNEEIENENENEKLANATRDHHYCRLKYSDDAGTAVSRATNNGDNNSLNEGGTEKVKTHDTNNLMVELAKILVASLITVSVSAVTCAQSVVTDDAHTSNGQKDSAENFGTNPNLFVSATNTTYLKFELTPTVPAGTPRFRSLEIRTPPTRSMQAILRRPVAHSTLSSTSVGLNQERS